MGLDEFRKGKGSSSTKQSIMSHHVYDGGNSSSNLHYECIMSPRLSSSSCHLHHGIKAIIKAIIKSCHLHHGTKAIMKAIIIIMSSSCTSSSQLDQSPQELYHRHHQVINWTMGSTIRYMAPPHQTGSISIIKIIKAHKGPSSALQGSLNIIYKHQSSCIML